MRLALEGSRAFALGGGVLTQSLEVGLRHDGGDAETGTGVELGVPPLVERRGLGLSDSARDGRQTHHPGLTGDWG